MQNRLLSQDGKPIVFLCIDTTAISVDQSQDAFAQMQTHSGERGKGHCLLFSNLSCPAGTLVQVTPSPNISCTPRGGDGTSLGVQLALGRDGNSGCPRVILGTNNVRVALVHDRGYLFNPTNVNTGTNPTVTEFCDDNNILSLSRWKVGEKCYRYYCQALSGPNSA